MLRRHHVRCLEEGDHPQNRANRHHRRRRAWADVPCPSPQDGRTQRDRRRHRSRQTRSCEESRRHGRGRRRRRDAVQQIVDLTKGGAWAVIDLVGSSRSARLGYDSLIKGGKYIIVGLFGGDLTVSLPPIPMRALTIQGSYVGSVPEMAELMDLVRRTGLPDLPITTRPLKDVNAVHEDLRAGRVVGRVVLTPATG